MNEFVQTPFDFGSRTLHGRDDFFISKSNERAVKLVEHLPVDFYASVVFGTKGCGKTHLAHLYKDVIAKTKNETVCFLQNLDVAFALQQGRYFVWEKSDADFNQEALFHLMNGVKNTGGFLLITCRTPPNEWNLTLPDLISRLKACPTIEITFPDDALIQAVLIKLFADKQLSVSPEVLSYILKHIHRSFESIVTLVECADQESLTFKRPVTIPLIKKILK